MGNSQGDDVQAYDPFYDRAHWYYTFSWWPRRCELSNKRIWMQRAYKGIRMITGPGEPVFEVRWITRENFMIARLKGLI